MEPGGLQGFSHGLGVNRRERDVRGGCPDHWHDNVVPCPAAHLTGHLAGERCKKERLAMLTKHAPCADIVDPRSAGCERSSLIRRKAVHGRPHEREDFVDTPALDRRR
jgi:hypothetical protein